jgi:hypothetical protein
MTSIIIENLNVTITPEAQTRTKPATTSTSHCATWE